jgi:3'(2'), 5'-bisphosphate nucleotidase
LTKKQDYTKERAAARQLVIEAGKVVLEWHERGVKIDWKGEDDPVTSADHAANDLILEGLHQRFPDDAVLSEESRDDLSRLEAERVWIVDPLDGTKDFVTGTGDFSVLLGLVVAGKPVVGAVSRPLDGRVWHASVGQGALMEDGQRTVACRVSDITAPSEMRLVVTRSHRFALLEEAMQTLGITKERPLGSVGLKVGALATAEADLYIHLSIGIKEWDTCAPEVILTEAGGRISDTAGRPLPYNGRDVMRHRGIVASNGRAHDRIIEVLEPSARKAGLLGT